MVHPLLSSLPRRALTVSMAAALTLAPLGAVPAASADTAPVPPEPTTTVSADSLPTVQINGVVWAQLVVGNRVYVTGSFSQARPAGAAAGTNQTARSNILAYDLSTGALVTSWAPTLNGQGMGLAASPDGSRIYVVGDFTSVSGVSRQRVAALDPTTGAVVTAFNPRTNARTRTVAVSGSTVYVGGTFTTANGVARSRLAAFSATDGSLAAWDPGADAEVFAVVAPAGSGKVVAGGRFVTLAGADNYGMGAVDATTGAALPWPANQVIRNAGPDAAIYSLSTNGTSVFGTGYTFLVNPGTENDGNLEGTFSADAATGNINWVTSCRGDTYTSMPIGDVLYSAGHAHDCSSVGGNPQTDPWTFQRALAQTIGQGPNGAVNLGGRFVGRPAPMNLHWLPTLVAGSFTGQTQAAWSVAGNADYVVLGGEFPSVNGTAQQGLARFAVRSIAPNQQGPQGTTELQPTLLSLAPGSLRVSWTSAWDRDNKRLTYEVLRGATVGSATVIATLTGNSTWWNRPPMAVTDASAPPGSTQTYRVRATDPLGNVVTSAATTVTLPAGTPGPTAYRAAVMGDGAQHYWRLGESGGTTAYDWASADDLTLDASATRGVAGAIPGDAATTFTGSATVPGTTATLQAGPNTFSVEAWIKTTTTRGGEIIGFGNSRTGNSSNYDRLLYLTNAGRITFGAHPGVTRAITSPNAYNDGQWHYVVGTLGSGGMNLYVDGGRVAGRTDTTGAQAYAGYWRVGGDNLSGWPSQPSSSRLAGTIDEVAVYPSALPAATVAQHWALRTSTGTSNAPPAAAFTSSVSDLTASFDASGSSDADGTVASFAWDFGDGGTGTGQTPAHTYAAAGTYTVTLTVTDDDGATGTVSHPVTVTAPGEPQTVAADTFSRTTSSGFGSAETGGAWSVTGTSVATSVADGSGRVSIPAGRTGTMRLGSVSSPDTDLRHTFRLEQVPTGGGVYLSTTVRSTASGDYRLKLRVMSSGQVTSQLIKVVGGTETALTTATTVPGLTYTAGARVAVRVQATGSAPTTLRAKVWAAAGSEPATWLSSVTDATSGLQSAGAVGWVAYTSSTATATVVFRFDDLLAVAT